MLWYTETMMAKSSEHPDVLAGLPTPIAILVVSAWIGGRYRIVVWPTLLTWMGVACLLNARRCHRLAHGSSVPVD
jgi:hypothetical protein